ncbi:MAG: DUF2934 domain-containing protein [Candidatus Omnitrophica bacterium]|nr:DUF2934 domain-containing protein [Candidatus Omnitrophota bacterium]
MSTRMLDRLDEVVKGKRGKAKAAPVVDAQSFAERVEKKAYELYERRGCKIGQDWQNWFDAEKLVEDEMIAER